MNDRLFTCDAPIDLAATVLDDGTVEIEAKVLEVGRKVQRGGAGEFEITEQHLAEMVRNHEQDAARGYEPPAVVGHPRERDQAPAVGWIKGLRAAADGLYAKVRFLGEFAKRIKAGEFRYSSPSFSFNWHDETGAERGAKLLDLGILNNPFQKSLGAFALSEITAGSDPGADPAQPSLPGVGDGPEDHTMSDKTIELTERVANLSRDLEDKNTEITSLSEQVTTLTDERDSLTAKLSEAETERDQLKAELSDLNRAKEDAEITAVLGAALSDGKLTPAQVPGHGTDDFDGHAWLSESPYNGLDGLRKFLKTAPRVVDLGERKTLSSSGDASDAGKRERIARLAEAAKAVNPSISDDDAYKLAEANA